MWQLTDDYKHKGLRKALVKTIESKGISDTSVLEAINKVPRHYFFDEAFLEHAYQDKAFPIGEGQTISQPYTVAFQTQLLEVARGNKILEVGTGSGYQACVLIEMGATVFTIESNERLYERAKKFLPEIGYRPRFSLGDGSAGWSGQAPFDRILVTAGAPEIPKSLVNQLNPGGILVIPIGNKKRQRMVKVYKTEQNEILKEEHAFFCFVPLIGSEGWRK